MASSPRSQFLRLRTARPTELERLHHSHVRTSPIRLHRNSVNKWSMNLADSPV